MYDMTCMDCKSSSGLGGGLVNQESALPQSINLQEGAAWLYFFRGFGHPPPGSERKVFPFLRVTAALPAPAAPGGVGIEI